MINRFYANAVQYNKVVIIRVILELKLDFELFSEINCVGKPFIKATRWWHSCKRLVENEVLVCEEVSMIHTFE